MTLEEACKTLAVANDASETAIKKAIKNQIKNQIKKALLVEGDCGVVRGRMIALLRTAASILLPAARRSPIAACAAKARQRGRGAPETLRAVKITRAFLKRRRIVVLYDGTFQRLSDLRMAENHTDLDKLLRHEDLSEEWLLARLALEQSQRPDGLSRSEIQSALHLILHRDRGLRRWEVMRPLYHKVTSAERAAADTMWQELGTVVFEGNSALVIACLQHFVWQVKNKSLRKPVTRHLMPVICSSIQGTGKTTFVQRFLAPLQELAPAPVLLTDLVDPRAGDIFRYPALTVDDMGDISGKHVSTFKSLLTTGKIQRRRMGTSLSVGYQQRTTLIGTANHTVNELISDDTGHRRFVTLSFANGEVAKGGNSAVWEVINRIDYKLLWRSVDIDMASPIEGVLNELAETQEADSPQKMLRDWLFTLDVNSDAVLNIAEKRGITPTALFELFRQHTGCEITQARFGQLMTQLAKHERCPFHPQRRTGAVRYWPLKALSTDDSF